MPQVVSAFVVMQLGNVLLETAACLISDHSCSLQFVLFSNCSAVWSNSHSTVPVKVIVTVTVTVTVIVTVTVTVAASTIISCVHNSTACFMFCCNAAAWQTS